MQAFSIVKTSSIADLAECRRRVVSRKIRASDAVVQLIVDLAFGPDRIGSDDRRSIALIQTGGPQ